MSIFASSVASAPRGLLPPTVENGLKSSMARGGGLVLIASAVCGFLALVTWSASDPALTQVGGLPSSNLLGSIGAHGADLVLQSLGIAAAVLLFAPIFWGVELLLSERASELRHRLLLWPVSVILLAAALAAVPTPSAWPLDHGFGGIVGDLVYNLMRQPAAALDPRIAAPIMLLLLAAAGVLSQSLALDIDPRSLRPRPRLPEPDVEIEPAPEPVPAPSAAAASDEPQPERRTVLGLVLAEDGDPDDPLIADTADGESALIAPRDADSLAMAKRFAPAVAPDAEPALREPPALAPIAPETDPDPRPVGEPGEALLASLAGEPQFRLPSLNLLNRQGSPRPAASVEQAVLRGNARLLEDALGEFGVGARITGMRPGPVVTTFELEPQRGVRAQRVVALAEEIARAMGAASARVAALPGRSGITIELPNARTGDIGLRELLEAEAFRRSAAALPLAVGRSSTGEAVVADLARLRHLLVAGAPGSGKTAGVNGMILSLLYKRTPAELRLILIDPRMIELSVYGGLPHLLSPVITDTRKAVAALEWAGREMAERQKRMSMHNVRSIDGFNNAIANARRQGLSLNRKVHVGFDRRTGEPLHEEAVLAAELMPAIVIVIEELAEIVLGSGRELEAALQPLAQGGAAAGIHVIGCTQRPTADVVTEAVGRSLPGRICYRVASRADSRNVLGDAGAELLLGSGDLLMLQEQGELVRAHGPHVEESEVERVAGDLARQGRPQHVPGITAPAAEVVAPAPAEAPGDGIYERALALYVRDRETGVPLLRRKLGIGEREAAELLARLRLEGH